MKNKSTIISWILVAVIAGALFACGVTSLDYSNGSYTINYNKESGINASTPNTTITVKHNTTSAQ